MTSPSLASRKIIDVEDILATVRHLNEAIFMAASHSNVTSEASAALQAVSEEIDNKLLIARDRLEEIREELQ